MGSAFFRQVNDAILRTKSDLKPLQLMINIMSLVMFPFVGSPILRLIGDLNMDQFNQLMLEIKNLIPIWIKYMLT